MTQSAATIHVQTLVRAFDESLNRAGYRTKSVGEDPADWMWTGTAGTAHERVQITLPEVFPYGAPEVVLPDRDGGTSWHRAADGVLCLWDRHSQGDLPWLDGPTLIARIEDWIVGADGSWADDQPQLDLEAYHSLHTLRRGEKLIIPMLVIDDWEDLAGHWFRARPPAATGVVRVSMSRLPAPVVRPPGKGQGRKPKGTQRGRRNPERMLDGVAVDLGEMGAPLVSTDDLLDALGGQLPAVARLLENGRSVLIAARYLRSGASGLIGFWLTKSGDRFTRGCIPIAEVRRSQRRRAGWHAELIADRTVSIVGVGSIGSYVADMLHRSGVRHIRVHDWDTLQPGNLVRHSSSPAFVGSSKTDAVRDTAAERDPLWPMRSDGMVRSLSDAISLMEEQDLVIDCTGDRLTWQLFQAAAEVSQRRFLHVAVEGHGQFGRVDICPPFHAAAPLRPNSVQGIELNEREGGCGDPISPTPPTAVVETAAMGARIAVRMLANEPVPAAGECRPLFPVVP